MDAKYNPQQEEVFLARYWIENEIYKPNQTDKPMYSIDTPPPTVSGSLHLGHIFSYTQTDIIARYKRMSGFCVYYPFGFDDNGLATERFVEKQCGIQSNKMQRKEFIELCLQQTELAEDDFKLLWQRIGLSIDWNYSYRTISDATRALSQASFLDLYRKGYVYRAAQPALYCSSCRTTIAQAELDDQEVPSCFYDIVFKDKNNNSLVVGTTRPELLFSCVALLYHPDDIRYKQLHGQQAWVPIANYQVPILADQTVVPEKGTGLVMCCTFGDRTDIEWYKKLTLPYKPSINEYGKFMDHTPLAGLSVLDGRVKIVEILQQSALITDQKKITHSVNVHERCKRQIEFLIVPQWFISVMPYKKELLALADAINWYPAFMKARYIHWVENLNWDWCISRQRHFGIPFPVWHCTECKAILTPEQKELPVDPQEAPYSKNMCAHCGSRSIEPDTDIMDTWNTSSITPYIVLKLLHPEMRYFVNDSSSVIEPMSMRPQAHDIIRTWAFYTIVKSWMHDKMIPWQSIVISGHVLSSAKQEKLSKSLENSSTNPQNLLNQYCADAIRYWTASGRLGHDIAFSDAQVRIGNKLITKLWNAFRFLLPHIANVEDDIPSKLGTLNEWILTQSTECFDRYQNYFSEYDFSLALDAVEAFFWKQFCDNYLELVKHQLFNEAEYDKDAVRATKWTMHTVGLRILQLYAPYLPYITDTIYRQLYKDSMNELSIHRTLFAKTCRPYSFPHSNTIMDSIIHIVNQARKLKSENKLSLNFPLELITIIVQDSELMSHIANNEQLIKGVMHAKHIACQMGTGLISRLDMSNESASAIIVI